MSSEREVITIRVGGTYYVKDGPNESFYDVESGLQIEPWTRAVIGGAPADEGGVELPEWQ